MRREQSLPARESSTVTLKTSQSFCRNKVPLNVSPAGWGFVGLQLCETWPAAVLWLQQPRIPLCAPG